MIVSSEESSTPDWDAPLGVDALFRLLGSPDRRAMLGSRATPFAHRSHWACGCALDYNMADGGGAFAWHGCVAHRELAGASPSTWPQTP